MPELLKRLSCLLSIVLITAGCNETSPTDSESVSTFTLSAGESVLLSPEGWQIHFDDLIHDSRCPSGVDSCQWPGFAEIALRVIDQNDTQNVVLAIRGDFPEDGSRKKWPVRVNSLWLLLNELSEITSQSNAGEMYQARISALRTGLPLDNVIISDLFPERILLDEFMIDSATIHQQTLTLTVSYSGGCAEHYFSIFMSPSGFSDSNPKEADLYIRHFVFADPCRMLITRHLTFNLGPVADQYRNLFKSEDTILVNLYEFANGQSALKQTVIYEPIGPQ